MKYDTKFREEELKHKVAADWFAAYDCTRVIGNIDFAVDMPATELALGYASEPALWAEAKAGARKDIAESFVQLILTIGRARLADELPPLFLERDATELKRFIRVNFRRGCLSLSPLRSARSMPRSQTANQLLQALPKEISMKNITPVFFAVLLISFGCSDKRNR